MKRAFISISLILLMLLVDSKSAFSADYETELVTDPMQSSLIDMNTFGERRLQKIKKHRIKKNKKGSASADQQNQAQSDVIVDSDFMNYYPDKKEIEAIGNAKVTFTKDNLVLKANRIVYNHDLNDIKAYDNVRLINKESVTEGDFLNLDMNQENGWMKNPYTKNVSIEIKSDEGYVYSDRIEEYHGVAKILKNKPIIVGATSFESWVNPGHLGFDDYEHKNPKEIARDKKLIEQKNPKSNGAYSIKAKVVYIDSLEGHDTITMNNADLYLKKYRLGSIPSLRILSDKKPQVFETNIPEFGQASGLGKYIGPGIVLPAPADGVLKLVPLVNYDESKVGAGFIARYRNAQNMTSMAYGSATGEFVINGRQHLTENLDLDYSQNSFQDDWFLGARRPRYGTQLRYNKQDYIDDLGMSFEQRFSAGAFVDQEKQIGNVDGRFKWMTQSQKTFYRYRNLNSDFTLMAGLVGQTSLALYTTGDTLGVARFGPMLKTIYKNWSQEIFYFATATGGQTPFLFDRYMYGKSNVVFAESLKLNKYVTIGYLGSLAFFRDNPDDNMFQEDRFLLSLGPDYAKVTFGYDAYRQTSMVLLTMLVGSAGSEVKFDKAVMKNPDTLSKNREAEKKKHLIDFTKIFPSLKKPE